MAIRPYGRSLRIISASSIVATASGCSGDSLALSVAVNSGKIGVV